MNELDKLDKLVMCFASAVLVFIHAYIYTQFHKTEEQFPISDILKKIGGSNYTASKKIFYQDHAGYIIKSSGDSGFVALVLEDKLILGNVIDRNGNDITESLAKTHDAQTFLTALAQRSPLPHKQSSSRMDNSAPAAKGETTINRELYNYILSLPGIELNPAVPDKAVRLIIFSWEGCASCRTLKNIIASEKDKITFRIREIPTGGTERAEKDSMKALGRTEEDYDMRLKGIREAAAIVKKLTGKMAVPCYVWLMPDGETRFGYIQASEVLDRIRMLSKNEEK